MCGRITQTRAAIAYAKEMGWVDANYRKYDWQPNWNVPPGSDEPLRHGTEPGLELGYYLDAGAGEGNVLSLVHDS